MFRITDHNFFDIFICTLSEHIVPICMVGSEHLRVVIILPDYLFFYSKNSIRTIIIKRHYSIRLSIMLAMYIF